MNSLASLDMQVITLTLKLALVVSTLLLLISTPLAWWLAQTRSRLKPLVSAFFTLPLVLPPTVLGFYLLLLMGAQGPIGKLTNVLGLPLLPFSFWGIALACALHSLPFVLQPLVNTFNSIGQRPLDVAATLRASPLDCFIHVVLPQARHGFMTAFIMGFCHSIGEFGVVLMIGGNIPGQTRVMSIELFNLVEGMNYQQAHWLAGAMVVVSFAALLVVYLLNQRQQERLNT